MYLKNIRKTFRYLLTFQIRGLLNEKKKHNKKSTGPRSFNDTIVFIENLSEWDYNGPCSFLEQVKREQVTACCSKAAPMSHRHQSTTQTLDVTRKTICNNIDVIKGDLIVEMAEYQNIPRISSVGANNSQ